MWIHSRLLSVVNAEKNVIPVIGTSTTSESSNTNKTAVPSNHLSDEGKGINLVRELNPSMERSSPTYRSSY